MKTSTVPWKNFFMIFLLNAVDWGLEWFVEVKGIKGRDEVWSFGLDG